MDWESLSCDTFARERKSRLGPHCQLGQQLSPVTTHHQSTAVLIAPEAKVSSASSGFPAGVVQSLRLSSVDTGAGSRV